MRNPARRGFAVLFALFAIILLGALSTAMVFAAAQETKASSGVLAATRALSAVESSVTKTVTDTDWSVAMALRPGQFLTILADNGTTRVWVARLDSTVFTVSASTPDPLATHANERFVSRVGLTIEVGADSAGVLRALRVPGRGWIELF